MKHIWPLLLALLAGCSESGAERAQVPFDFYVLAMSWSASYCIAEGDDANAQQCGRGGPEGFVLHGLWPQFERGYPEFCPLNDNGRFSRPELASLRDLFPSNAMIRHQWRKHGSCTGLARDEYFATVRAARQRVRVPVIFRQPGGQHSLSAAEVEAAFRKANPGLAADAIAVTCDGEMLRDVRICLSRDLDFRSCAEVDRRGCTLRRTVLPAFPGR